MTQPSIHSGIDAWRHWGLALMGISLNRSCVTGESEIAYLCCISSKHIYMEDSWLLGVVLVCLYCISLLHIFIAYLYCIASLHLFIAYLYCISLLHIFKAYLYCISLLSCCCLLLFGSWVDFWSFGSVFVRFLVVLEWSEGCFGRSFGGLGGSWAAPGRSWVGLGRSRALLGRSWPILGRS